MRARLFASAGETARRSSAAVRLLRWDNSNASVVSVTPLEDCTNDPSPISLSSRALSAISTPLDLLCACHALPNPNPLIEFFALCRLTAPLACLNGANNGRGGEMSALSRNWVDGRFFIGDGDQRETSVSLSWSTVSLSLASPIGAAGIRPGVIGRSAPEDSWSRSSCPRMELRGPGGFDIRRS